MKCPYCSSFETKVVDSRSAQKNTAIRRRRECIGCGHRFTTYEHVVEFPLVVIKNDGRREEYDRNKLVKSLKIACNKRPISFDVIEEIILDIEKEIEQVGGAELKSSIIGELVMKHLKKVDDISYIRFASVYKEFKDIDEFRDQLDYLS